MSPDDSTLAGQLQAAAEDRSHDVSPATRYVMRAAADRLNEEGAPGPQHLDRQLVRRIAMDVGKAAVSHLRVMYPQVFEKMSASCQLSLRNCVHNEIMAAISTTDAGEIERRLHDRAQDRRRTHAFHDKLRKDRP